MSPSPTRRASPSDHLPPPLVVKPGDVEWCLHVLTAVPADAPAMAMGVCRLRIADPGPRIREWEGWHGGGDRVRERLEDGLVAACADPAVADDCIAAVMADDGLRKKNTGGVRAWGSKRTEAARVIAEPVVRAMFRVAILHDRADAATTLATAIGTRGGFGWDGSDALRIAAAQPRTIPAILLSGGDHESTVLKRRCVVAAWAAAHAADMDADLRARISAAMRGPGMADPRIQQAKAMIDPDLGDRVEGLAGCNRHALAALAVRVAVDPDLLVDAVRTMGAETIRAAKIKDDHGSSSSGHDVGKPSDPPTSSDDGERLRILHAAARMSPAAYAGAIRGRLAGGFPTGKPGHRIVDDLVFLARTTGDADTMGAVARRAIADGRFLIAAMALPDAGHPAMADLHAAIMDGAVAIEDVGPVDHGEHGHPRLAADVAARCMDAILRRSSDDVAAAHGSMHCFVRDVAARLDQDGATALAAIHVLHGPSERRTEPPPTHAVPFVGRMVSAMADPDLRDAVIARISASMGKPDAMRLLAACTA